MKISKNRLSSLVSQVIKEESDAFAVQGEAPNLPEGFKDFKFDSEAHSYVNFVPGPFKKYDKYFYDPYKKGNEYMFQVKVNGTVKNILPGKPGHDVLMGRIKKGNEYQISQTKSGLSKAAKDVANAIVSFLDLTNYGDGEGEINDELKDYLFQINTEKGIEAIKNSSDPYYKHAVFMHLRQACQKNKNVKLADCIDAAAKYLDLKEPSEDELSKSQSYQNAKKAAGDSPLFKNSIEPVRSTFGDPKESDSKEPKNESSQINEKRIRAIIRHELIRAQRKR
jgi:hypothetical protein